MIRAALVKGNTSMNNNWLAKRPGMGHHSATSQLVNRMRKDPNRLRILERHENRFKSKEPLL